MVAQAYPDKFQVERDIYASMPAASGSYGGGASVGSSSVYMGSSAYPYPMYDPFYSSYYYYSPFAYPYYWGPYYSYRMGSPYYRNYYNYYYNYGLPGSGYYYGGGSSGSSAAAIAHCPDRPTRPAATASSSTDADTRE